MERDMDAVEEVKKGKKRLEPEVTPTPRKLCPLFYKQRGKTLIKSMKHAPSFSFDSPKLLKQSHYL